MRAGIGRWLVAAAMLAVAAAPARADDKVVVGVLPSVSSAPLFIAKEKGYFKAEGLDVDFRYFDAAQPIAAAVVSGDLDFGGTALTGGFFNLAGKGAVKAIAGMFHERPGIEGQAVVVSKKVHDAGFTSLEKFPGHSFAITQTGSSFHYIIGRIAEKVGFDLKTVTLRPLQTVPNMIAAMRTGQVDAALYQGSVVKPLVASGEAVILAWSGDYVPYQSSALFTGTKTIAGKRKMVESFMRAFKRGIADYRAAFLTPGPDGKPKHGPTADEMVGLIARHVFKGDPQAGEKIRLGLINYDEDGFLDTEDIGRQIEWFKAQGMIDANVTLEQVVDTGFVKTSGSK